MQAPQRNAWQTAAYYIGLYGIYLKNYGRRLIEYRGDTLVAMLGGFMMQAGFLIFLQVIYKRIPQLNGFTQNELLFLFGFVTLGRELSRMFLDSPFRVGMLIRRGQLDIFLIRPCSTLFEVVAVDVQVVAVGGAVVAIAVMGMALEQMPHLISFASMSWLVIAVICNMFLQYC